MTTQTDQPAPARPAAVPSHSRQRRVDTDILATWLLAGGLVLYLGLDGGGYDIIVRSHAGIVVWWAVLVGAVCGLVPASRLTRTAWLSVALFGGFVAWTGLATTWSLSSERSLQELSRVAMYLGVLVLGIVVHRRRRRAIRHTVYAVSSAIVLIAALAVASRLFPDAFPAARTTAAFLPSVRARLTWPLNYWNALAALVAMGLPLVLSIATSGRRVAVQAAAAAAIPLLLLCSYLTFSRGGAVAAGVAVAVFLAFAPQRLPKLATMLVTGAGGAILILEAAHRSAIAHGLTGPAATSQGGQLLLWTLLICAAVAISQVGLALLGRRWHPGWITVSRSRARVLLAAGALGAVIVALALGAPSRLDHSWQQFKSRTAASGHNSLGRYGSASGEGRYTFWKVALRATSGERLQGSGPGTFQLLWEPRAPFFSHVVNAHSLYVETLAEVGVVGLLLLVGFFAVVLAATGRAVAGTSDHTRLLAAGVSGALLAFLVSATVDWIWQVPVLPVVFLLLAGTVLAPRRPRSSQPRAVIALRAGLVVVALACLVAIAIPLGTTSFVRQSQAAAAVGDTSRALADARTAARLEPGAASPQLQEALVLEARGEFAAAITAARAAARDESANWSPWFVLARLEAESGQIHAAVDAYRRARADNPRSPIFR